MTDSSNGTNPPAHAGVTLPPPLIYLGVLCLALALDWLIAGPGFGMPPLPRLLLGGILVLVGLALVLSAGYRFHIAGTPAPPWKPVTAFVTNGIYRYTRNPMYLGMAIVYAGLAVCADSVIALVALVAVIVIIRYQVIGREERYMEAKFGEEYRMFKRQVRRWL
jgi:protein-S-isoprenylcysteine O-methyltransferase Ste14